MSSALLLNHSYEPLRIVSWQRGVQLLFQKKAEVIEESELVIRSVSITMKLPAVLRMLYYIPLIRKKTLVRFSRINVFIRDKHICQYCGKYFSRSQLTLDHVIPIVQGGNKSWENIVTACKKCNQKKGGKTPHEAGIALIKKPKEPHWLMEKLDIKNPTPESWKIYLKHE
jgi:5-methylcytosine-specific restriction endonuclease McrA